MSDPPYPYTWIKALGQKHYNTYNNVLGGTVVEAVSDGTDMGEECEAANRVSGDGKFAREAWREFP